MDTSEDGEGGGVDSRQLLYVGICLVGLVTAAFLAPVTDENDPIGIDGDAPGGLLADLLELLFDRSDDEADERQPRDDGGDGDGGGGDGGGDGLLDWLRDLFDWGSDGDSEATGGPSRCQVYVGSDPTPGRPTTVLVTVDREPASDVRVWFNGDFVGRTDERGVVAAEAPYARELNVTVESPIEERCAFSRQPSLGRAKSGLVDPPQPDGGKRERGPVPGDPGNSRRVRVCWGLISVPDACKDILRTTASERGTH